jgi:hypothetical protein
VAGVVTNRQELIPCQLVLVCTGTTPVTTLAESCDLPMQHRQGILVDDSLRTSTRDIYAAGDVAALRDPQTGRYSTRAQWYAAVLQGRVAAAAMTGTPHEESFGVPWHATRLGELSMLTVGNPLLWREAAAILTDSSRGSYRRLTIIDDRLIGYLSLGPAQPDSLAIKRIIDEGLSIRDIKKGLLKGNLDARTYFSRKRTFAAERMVTTGKLPTPLPRPVDDIYIDTEMPGIRGHDASRSYNGPIKALPTTPVRLAHVLPDTDPLIARQQAREAGRHIVESTLMALPSRSAIQASRNLWSYSDKIPVVKDTMSPGRLRPKHGKQFMAPSAIVRS